jgi:hypothetical protein
MSFHFIHAFAHTNTMGRSTNVKSWTMSTVTIVTALYDLTKYDNADRDTTYRSFDRYKELSKQVMDLDAPMVIYTSPAQSEQGQPDLAAWFREYRNQVQPTQRTLIVVRPLEHFPVWVRHYDTLVKNAATLQGSNPHKDTVPYRILMASKFSMLTEVAATNPFQTSHIAWIDMGVAHVASPLVLPTPHDWEVDKFTVMEMAHPYGSEVPEAFLERWRGNVAGGFLAGPAQQVSQVCELFFKEWDMAIAAQLAPLEDMVLAYVLRKYPEKFRTYYGDYESLFCNYTGIRKNMGTIVYNLEQCIARHDHPHAHSITHDVTKALMGQTLQDCDPRCIFVSLYWWLHLSLLNKFYRDAQVGVMLLQQRYIQQPGFAYWVDANREALHRMCQQLPHHQFFDYTKPDFRLQYDPTLIATTTPCQCEWRSQK